MKGSREIRRRVNRYKVKGYKHIDDLDLEIKVSKNKNISERNACRGNIMNKVIDEILHERRSI